jgi:hypothetical protein
MRTSCTKPNLKHPPKLHLELPNNQSKFHYRNKRRNVKFKSILRIIWKTVDFSHKERIADNLSYLETLKFLIFVV